MKRLPGFTSITIVLAALVVLLGALCLFDPPVGAVLVQLATLVVLAVTLVVLRDYAVDTKTIATASMKQAEAAMGQVRAAREQRGREDKQALGGVALLLLDYARGRSLNVDSLNDQQRYRWGMLVKIAETILTIEDAAFIPLCAEISQFVIQAGDKFVPDEAIHLFGEAARLANPALIEEYERLEKERATAPQGPSSLSGAPPAGANEAPPQLPLRREGAVRRRVL
jgi:hypothetical protein